MSIADYLTLNNIQAALNIAETIAANVSKAAPNATVGGVKLSTIVQVGTEAANGSADAAAYITNMKALATQTTDPTPAQWASLDKETADDVTHLLDSTK